MYNILGFIQYIGFILPIQPSYSYMRKAVSYRGSYNCNVSEQCSMIVSIAWFFQSVCQILTSMLAKFGCHARCYGSAGHPCPVHMDLKLNVKVEIDLKISLRVWAVLMYVLVRLY